MKPRAETKAESTANGNDVIDSCAEEDEEDGCASIDGRRQVARGSWIELANPRPDGYRTTFFNGTFKLPGGTSFGDLDPRRDPFVFSVLDADGNPRVAQTFPVVGAGHNGGIGWRFNARDAKWVFEDPSYPILGTWTISFAPEFGPTLDGAAHLARSAADDYAAIQWITAGLPRGVIAEAARSGTSYPGYGRIATHTVLPAVLGWDFHEWQWRGSWTEQGSRVQDLATLYTTRDWNEAREIMDRYDIDYVYLGPLEASTFQPIAVTRFGLFLKKIYDNGAVVIFARPEAPVP